MLTTLLTFISAILLCTVIYLIISKNRNSRTNARNLQTGENLNIDLLGNLFWKVFNTSNHAILLLQDYKIVNCNQMALKLFDSDYDYLIGKTPFDLSPEFQPDGERSNSKGKKMLEDCFKEGVVNFEWSQRKMNNQLFFAEISITSFETNGKYYVAATMRDITLQKKEEQELVKYRQHLEKLVREKTELLEASNIQLRELNQELDTANEELKSNNEELLCTNENLEKEIQEHQKTQEKKAIAEEKIKQFIHQSSNGIIIINSQGIIEEWNEAITRISGIDKAQAVNNFIWNINSQWSPSCNKEAEAERFKKYTLDFFNNIKKENALLHAFESKIKHTSLGEKYLQIFMYPIVTSTENYAGCLIIDITQKKAIEAELDKYKTELETLLASNSERLMQLSSRFNEVYSVSADAITFIDIEDERSLKVFDMNPTAQKVFKITPDNIKKGIYAKDLLPPEKITPFLEIMLPRILQGETISFTDDIDIGNGYWRSTIYPIKDADGRISRIASISKNITAEKQNEKTTALLNLAIDSWPHELWVADNKGKCILQNKAALSLWGNMVGVPLEDSDISDDFKKASIIDSQKALSGETVSSEFVLDTPAGKRFVLFNLHPIRIANQLNGYLGIGFDITERKHWEEQIKASEEKYRLLAENIDDVIWKMDLATLKYSYLSTSIYKLTGYTAKESLELTMEEMLMPDSLKLAQEILQNRLHEFNTGNPNAINQRYEFQLRCKDGSPVWVEMNTNFIADSSGKAKEIIATSRNINKRKEAEIALRESEKRLALLLSSITDYKFTVEFVDGKPISTFHSEGCRAVTGYSPDELINNPYLWYKMIHNDDRLFLKEWEENIKNGVEVEPLEHRIIRKNGEIIWISNTTVLKKDRKGNILGFDGLISDITKRKNAELALKESEALYSLITKLSGYVVYDYNAVNKTIKWAGAIEEVTGYTEDELKRLPINEIIELTHPDDWYKNDIDFDNLVQEYSTKKQLRLLTKSKQYIWIEAQAFIFFKDKQPVRWLGIIRDITEQRNAQEQILKSEEKFRTIFDASKDGIALLDKNLTIIDINKSLIAKTKFKTQDIIGNKSIDFLTAHAAEDTLKWINNIWGAQSIENFETELKLNSTENIPVEISAAPIVINKEDVILLIIRDISERKKLESILLKSVINTEERERLHFSQELHDELGPLLSAAKMYVDWLDKPNANISKEEIIPDIKALLEEASQSIRNVSFKLSPHILQNYGLFEAVKAFAEKIKDATKLEINITAPNIPRFAEISETVVYRVLCECINNTVKHAKASSIHIVFAKSSDQLAVNYSDNGIGFELQKVMNSRKGIGLLNMQSRLKSINGELRIDSSPGHGTNIFFKINTDNI